MSQGRRIKSLMQNPEFQSALVRLSIWLFAVIYIGLGASSSYYRVDLVFYQTLFGGFLVIFLGLLLSVCLYPSWPARRYLSLVVDITATSLCIIMTKEAVSPFYLLYIWIFISYGTRYGKQHLMAASALSVIAYLTVLTVLGQWQQYTFEVIFFLLLLILLPVYQYLLLRKLHQARLDAEQSDRAKSVFLSSMTHELRTPISGILGLAQLLRETPLNTDQRASIDSIASSAQLLDALVSDVLDLSRIEAGGLELRPLQLDIRQLIREVSTTVAAPAQEKLLELIVFVAPAVPRHLECDPLRLRQVLYNLLGNAIKFTEIGQVELRVELDSAGRLQFQVTDSGVGITAAEQARIFERFWQADDSMTTRHGGAGLGMTITHALVKQMEGQISVQSTPGEGSCFSFVIPLREVDDSEASTGYRWQGKRVLIYESHPGARSVLASYCDSFGMTCHLVERLGDLSEGLSQLEAQGGVDLAIICDSLNGQDLERIGRLVRQHLDEALPVLLVGYLGRHVQPLSGNSAQMLKPVTSDGLKLALDQLFGSDLAVEDDAVVLSQGRRPRILMAEDNDINAKVLSALLEGIGCQVDRAGNGEEALEMAGQGGYDIAIVDLRMPVLDGQGFTRVYRDREPDGSHLPIIALTANTASETREHCLQLGMDDFLAKPVDSARLRLMVEQFT